MWSKCRTRDPRAFPPLLFFSPPPTFRVTPFSDDKYHKLFLWRSLFCTSFSFLFFFPEILIALQQRSLSPLLPPLLWLYSLVIALSMFTCYSFAFFGRMGIFFFNLIYIWLTYLYVASSKMPQHRALWLTPPKRGLLLTTFCLLSYANLEVKNRPPDGRPAARSRPVCCR